MMIKKRDSSAIAVCGTRLLSSPVMQTLTSIYVQSPKMRADVSTVKPRLLDAVDARVPLWGAAREAEVRRQAAFAGEGAARRTLEPWS